MENRTLENGNIYFAPPVCRNPCRNLEVLIRLEAAAVDPDVEAEPEDRVPLRLEIHPQIHHVVTGRPEVEEQRQVGGGAQLQLELKISKKYF